MVDVERWTLASLDTAHRMLGDEGRSQPFPFGIVAALARAGTPAIEQRLALALGHLSRLEPRWPMARRALRHGLAVAALGRLVALGD